MESTGKRKALKSNLLAFPDKNKSKLHGKRYSNEAKDIICKAANWVKLTIEKQKHGQRPSETVAEHTCATCKISESTFYRTLKGKMEIKKKTDEEQKVDKNKILLKDCEKTVISRIVLSFYTRPKPELPTTDTKIHQDLLGITGIKK